MFFAVAVIFYLIFNSLSREYVEKAGDAITVPLSILMVAVAFILVYISQAIPILSISVVLFVISLTIFYNSTVRNSVSVSANQRIFMGGAGLGGFIGLIASGVFPGQISVLDSYMAIIMLAVGLVSVFIFFKRPTGKFRTADLLHVFIRPFNAMDRINTVEKKLLLLAVSLDEIFVWISIGASFPFIISAGLNSQMSRSSVMIAVAVAIIIGALLIYLFESSNIPALPFFYPAKDLVLVAGLLLISFMSPPAFVAGVIFLSLLPTAFIWSGRFISSQFPTSFDFRQITSFFRNPIMVISPLMGSILWAVSGNLLFLVAMSFAILALVIGIIVITNPRVFKVSDTYETANN
ncbi:MFS transporter permease [Thermoplasma sp. Kam2015]|uniref:MFS transporter permease n=1 Tax=Thermoplasma sp. Kam2015 TaxID=2094122 RepID=UPI001F3F8634|nr:MFS transporter permease [Thermoplasma sp. Kam2015]